MHRNRFLQAKGAGESVTILWSLFCDGNCIESSDPRYAVIKASFFI